MVRRSRYEQEGSDITQKWTRIEDMIIGHGLDPSAVAGELREYPILAQLEWFPSSPQLLGLNATVSSERIVTVPAGSTEVVPDPTPTRLTNELVILFDTEVHTGNAATDHLLKGGSSFGKVQSSGEEEAAAIEPTLTRIVEIDRAPVSSVPLLAIPEGVDLGDLELVNDYRVLLTELSAEKEGWNFGDPSLMTLSMADGEFQVSLITSDHLERIISHNWGMDAAITPGGHDRTPGLPDEVTDLIGDRLDLPEITEAIPSSDANTLWASAAAAGKESVWKVVCALGLRGFIASFPLGTTDLEDVEGTSVHLARSISDMAGRSVDIMMSQSQPVVKPLWSSCEFVVVECPWIIHTVVTAEVIGGAGMLVTAVCASSSHSGWMRFAGIMGGLMVVDSITKLSLARHISKRLTRHAGEA